jgi:hypothetical protein
VNYPVVFGNNPDEPLRHYRILRKGGTTLKGYISRESWIIAAICVADLVSTLIFVHYHGAREGNPLMDFYLQKGVVPFILAKCTMFLLPIAIIEWARRHNPDFVRRMARFAIVAYIGLYMVVVAKENILRPAPPQPVPPAVWSFYGPEYMYRVNGAAPPAFAPKGSPLADAEGMWR